MSEVDPKDYLRKMVDHTVAGDMEAAEQDFSDYLVPKAKEVLGIDLSAVQDNSGAESAESAESPVQETPAEEAESVETEESATDE